VVLGRKIRETIETNMQQYMLGTKIVLAQDGRYIRY
jgi:hypothetical protein